MSLIATKSRRNNEDLLYAKNAKTSLAKTLLIGDSIIKNFQRHYYPIWERYFQQFSTINVGISGDRAEQVLYRVQNGEIVRNLETVVIHVGTNNIDRNKPKDIANCILLIAKEFLQAKSNVDVIVTGLLPRDLHHTPRREK